MAGSPGAIHLAQVIAGWEHILNNKGFTSILENTVLMCGNQGLQPPLGKAGVHQPPHDKYQTNKAKPASNL